MGKLTERQLKTVSDLKEHVGISTPTEIVAWAKGKQLQESSKRGHSVDYFQQIIGHYKKR